MLTIENEYTFRDSLKKGINLFLGSGFSVLSYDVAGRQLPVGSQLCDELVEEFDLHSGLDLPKVATILNSAYADSLRSYLTSRFTVEEFDPLYHALFSLNIRSIFTTNIDNLLFKVFSNSTQHYLNDLDLRGAVQNDRSAIELCSLHGCVLDTKRNYTFSAQDIATAFRQDPDRWHMLTEAMQRSPTLYWGYSMGDASTLEALHPATIRGRSIRDCWIVIADEADEGAIQYFKALGFQIIVADTKQMLEYACGIGSKRKEEATVDEGALASFPEYSIPDINDVPLRSVIEFFKGEPPSWYDIFSGHLHKTRYHAAVRNSLNSGKDTIVLGLPASGKTTLLMQVLREYQFSGHKLICHAPTAEKAQLILRRLDDKRALIGIDNFTDSVDGVAILFGASNVQVLACDRAYNFDIVSHMFTHYKRNIIDITDLDDADIQSLIDTIPPEVQRASSKIIHLEGGVAPSIFEIIESNVVIPALRQRYSQVLRQVGSEDPRLQEFLLVCAYVHSCRTPVSLGMLIAYFRAQIDGDYEQVYEMREALGRMLSDYTGKLNDGIQDYFVPRSVMVAKAILEAAKPKTLKPMILRFHREVSPHRIHRFDIFRRRAYDAGFMKSVFVEWEEGRDFYDEVYFRDDSPYILQQGALYLANKKQYTEAFSMIDEALIKSERRIPSIRNTHAIILFKANIDRQDIDGTVKRTLDESMEILEECYREDERKAYHATTYADHALLYDSRFGRQLARGYLHQADNWLKLLAQQLPWHRNIKRLSKVVKKRLYHE